MALLRPKKNKPNQQFSTKQVGDYCYIIVNQCKSAFVHLLQGDAQMMDDVMTSFRSHIKP